MNKAIKTRKYLAGVLAVASTSVLLSLMPVYAYENAILNEIEINSTNGNSYQVVVKTDKDINIEKSITSNDKIVLDLRNTKPAKFINTIYNNASKIDHVIVQPVSDNQVRVFLQGANISSSKITLDTRKESLKLLNPVSASTALNNNPVSNDVNNQAPVQNNLTTQNADVSAQDSQNNQVSSPSDTAQNTAPDAVSQTAQQETIILNKPIESFKPMAASYDNSNSNEQEATSPLDAVQEAMGVGSSLKGLLNESSLGWIIAFIMLTGVIFGIFQLFKPRKRKSVKIDLSGGMKSRDLNLLKTYNSRQGLIGSGLKGSAYQNLTKKPGYSSISNYGIKEYQNSQLPPSGMNVGVTKLKMEAKALKAPSNIEPALKNAPRPKTAIQNKIGINDVSAAKSNIDSMRFIESMAKIYEKSGRADLAQGLQNSMIKAKVSKGSALG